MPRATTPTPRPAGREAGRERRRATLFASIAALALAGVLPGCSRSTPEQQLRDTIRTMAEAVEARDAIALFGHVADDFTRDSGDMDRRQLRALLLGLFLRNQKIKVLTTVREVRVQGDRATVRLGVLATGGAGILPETGRAWDVTTAWRRDGGDWKVFNAQWTD